MGQNFHAQGDEGFLQDHQYIFDFIFGLWKEGSFYRSWQFVLIFMHLSDRDLRFSWLIRVFSKVLVETFLVWGYLEEEKDPLLFQQRVEEAEKLYS